MSKPGDKPQTGPAADDAQDTASPVRTPDAAAQPPKPDKTDKAAAGAEKPAEPAKPAEPVKMNGKDHGSAKPVGDPKPAVEAKPAAPVSPPRAAPAQPPVRTRSGWGIGTAIQLVLAAILGGAVVQYVFPLATDAGLPVPAAVGGLSADVAEMRQALNAADLDGLRERLSGLEASLAVLSGSAAADGGTVPDDAVSDLRSRIQAAVELIGRMTARVERLEAVGAVSGDGTTRRNDGELTALSAQLQSDITGIRSRLDALTGALNQRSSALQDRIAAMETLIPADLAGQLSALATKSQMDAMEERLVALESNTTALDAKRAATAIALANLSRTASLGQPFSQELDAVRLVGADMSEIDSLAGLSNVGVRPAAAILADFDTVRRQALRAGGAASGNWWDRLWANLANLFLVRRRGPMEGETVEAIISRADDAARAGNLQGAAAEMAALDGPAADVSAVWLTEAQARLELDRLIISLSGRLLADLAR